MAPYLEMIPTAHFCYCTALDQVNITSDSFVVDGKLNSNMDFRADLGSSGVANDNSPWIANTTIGLASNSGQSPIDHNSATFDTRYTDTPGTPRVEINRPDNSLFNSERNSWPKLHDLAVHFQPQQLVPRTDTLEHFQPVVYPTDPCSS